MSASASVSEEPSPAVSPASSPRPNTQPNRSGGHQRDTPKLNARRGMLSSEASADGASTITKHDDDDGDDDNDDNHNDDNGDDDDDGIDRASLRLLFDQLERNGSGKLELEELLVVEKDVIERQGGVFDRERKLEQLAGMVDDPARAFQDGIDFELFCRAIIADIANAQNPPAHTHVTTNDSHGHGHHRGLSRANTFDGRRQTYGGHRTFGESVPSSYTARRRAPSGASSSSTRTSMTPTSSMVNGSHTHFRSKTLTAAQASDLALMAREMKAAKAAQSNSGSATPTHHSSISSQSLESSLASFVAQAKLAPSFITSLTGGNGNGESSTASSTSTAGRVTSASRMLSASRHRRARTMATRHALELHDPHDDPAPVPVPVAVPPTTDASSGISPSSSSSSGIRSISSTTSSLHSGEYMTHDHKNAMDTTNGTNTTVSSHNSSDTHHQQQYNDNSSTDDGYDHDGKIVERLEEAHDAVIRRDEEIMATIEGGRAILNKNDEVASKMLDLEDLFERQNAELDKTKREKAEQTKSHLKLQMLCEELQDDATRTISENERLKVQLRRQKRDADQELNGLRNARDTLEAERTELTRQVTDMGGTISKLRREKGEREVWLLRDQSELANLQKEWDAGKEEIARLKLVEVTYNRLQKELADTDQDNTNILTQENLRLEQVVAQMTNQVDEIQRARAAESHLYEEATVTAKKLRDTMQLLRAQGVIIPDDDGDHPTFGFMAAVSPHGATTRALTVADELGLNNHDDHKSQLPSPSLPLPLPSPSTTSNNGERSSRERARLKDINFQFFCVTALTVRASLDASPSDDHQVNNTSTVDLYRLAMQQRVPFHEYARWVEHELTSSTSSTINTVPSLPTTSVAS